MTYDGKVYDITDFVDKHPGGDKILLAGGGALEPFWALYAVHKAPEVAKMLDKYLIGVLKADEAGKLALDVSDPFSGEPSRHPALEVVSQKPFNAEAPPDLLPDSFLTPNALFFVRNHLPVPEVDPKSFRLSVKGMDAKRAVSLTLEDLQKLPRTSVTATIMCAGNRRSDMHKFRAVKGLDWKKTAVSNAEWTGVLLLDVLKAKGIAAEDCKHVQFVGLDKDITGSTYGASVPAEIALDPRAEVLIAFEMNGEPIPRDHGYPLRVVVPGIVGARNVKWLSEVRGGEGGREGRAGGPERLSRVRSEAATVAGNGA